MRAPWILLGVLAGLTVGCSTWKGMEPLPDSHPANVNAGAAEPTAPPDVLHIEGAWLPPGPVGKGVTELPPENSSAASPQPHPASPKPPVEKKAAPSAPPSPDQASVDALVVAYLQIQEALAKDSLAGVEKSLTKLRSSAERLAGSADPGLSKLGAGVKAAAPKRAGSLDRTRKSFQGLSRAVIALVSSTPPTEDSVPQLREIYCPMVKAPWLQSGSEVANPYYGSAMSTCGTLRKVFRDRPAKGASR